MKEIARVGGSKEQAVSNVSPHIEKVLDGDFHFARLCTENSVMRPSDNFLHCGTAAME
jgi:hypothetical protein